MAGKKVDIKTFSAENLVAEIAKQEAQLSSMKFDHAVRGLANPLQIRTSKREIAKLKTELRARELSALTPEQLSNRSKIRLRRRSN
jgi:large subunit ribosomal protein L29